jgi:hypothetical protein
VSFFVCSVLPEMGGYVATLSDDGHTIRWSRPVIGFLFSMEHLKSVMGADYSDTHVRVRSFDEVTQAILKYRVEADANGLFWGKSQEIHLEKRCTGTVEAVEMPYRVPRSLEPVTDSKGRRHYQYYSIVQVKAQLAEQRKTTKRRPQRPGRSSYTKRAARGPLRAPTSVAAASMIGAAVTETQGL